MESNDWTHIYTGSDFQIELLKNELSLVDVTVLIKKDALEVYGGITSTASLTRLFVPNDKLDIANPIAEHFDKLQKSE